MLTIPAIDLLNGQAVRLHKGSYEEVTVYDKSPLNQARKFKEAGFEHIHVVDLNGAKEGKFINLPHIKEIIDELGISVQTGGGIRTFEDVEMLLDAGLSKVICSSMAIKNEEDWLKALAKYPGKMILGMDLKDGKIAYSGWLETAEESVESFLSRMIEHGLQEVLCTDISKDGTLSGPNFELYESLQKQFPDIRLIASGGVSSLDDLHTLNDANIDAVVVGKAYYENRITLEEMAEFNR
ncbi:1-(5-phosphoribosyl)-5-[(5-phosphoribosylamino)methylideneamino]imidazole-4-carboxamide isomerase [Gracilimonas sediminicola]|uniref:1-(5-phosphoribosyl)-5-[(5-phosphoribosylamino)methylideneamino] imidazole-4-carboxamide isomerase n=1 Tax=Gracilimonas sediminicola TaxID=2952158 RepID=A0A9X2L3Y2_9BACT|nr:1-(5-phosphoribosyl)-5-[(5-phosphoribosylamino)methylideneamino]imidazole-4-carboxamide isomerase [Gracilimonas sediminicola]MCP9291829.1 1-(5-phosphoribosyl)-5-[(5-phosphoribosylamino)methylideneamino]imidazole-4-carboxamide isomerase [Gracilimonas sediminicola]